MIPVGTAVGYLTLDYKQFSSNLKTALGEATSLSGKFSDTLGAGLSTVGNQIAGIGRTLTTGLTVPLGAAAVSTVKFGSEFDKQMSSVQAVSNATTDDLNDMRDAAISWGEKTVYTATEAGKALYYMGLAGWEPKKSIAALGPVLNLAAAGDLELGRTSDIVTDAMTAMGYEAGKLTKGVENTARFTNSLAAAMSNSNTDVNQMGEAFKYVSPLAGALNMDINDLTLALGLMANVGVKGSQAGTGLRQALKNLIDPTDKAKAVMDKYGVSLFDANGKAKDMRTFMEELRGTFGDLEVDIYDANGELKTGEQIMEEYGHALPTSQQEELNAVVEIFGTRALPGILGIINQSDDKFYDLADAIDSSNEAFVLHNGTVYTMQDALAKFGEQAVRTGEDFKILGAAEGMAMMQMDNLQGDWTRFTSALGTSKIMITDLVKNSLREFVQRLTELVQWFNSLDEEQKKHILKIVAVIAAIGPLLLIFGKLIAGIGNVITGFSRMSEAFNLIKTGTVMLVTKFKNIFEAIKLARAGFTGFASQASGLGAVIGGLSLPILALIAAIALLVAAFVHLWKTNEDFRDKIKGIWSDIVDKFNDAGKKITDAINSLGFDFSSLGEAIYAAWDWLCNSLAPIITGLFENIATIIGGVIDIVVGVVQTIAGIIKGFKDGDWTLFIEGLKTIWNGVWTTLTSPFITLFNILTEYLGNFGLTWSDVWNGIKNYFVTLWNTIVAIVKTVWDAILEKIKTNIENILTIIQATMIIIKTVKQNIWNAIKTFVVNTWESIKTNISTTFEIIKAFINVTLTSIQITMQNIWTIIKTFIANTWEAIKTKISTTFEAIKTTISTILHSIQTTMQNIWSAIKTFIINTVENIKTSVIEKFNTLKTNVINTVENLKTSVTTKIEALKTSFLEKVESLKTSAVQKFESMKNALLEKLETLKTNAINKVTEIKSGIINVFSDIKAKFEEVGSNIIQGIWNGISNGWNWLKDKVKGVASSLLDEAKAALGIESPSKEFERQVGVFIPPGIANGFVKALPKAVNEMEKEFGDSMDKFDVHEIDITGLADTFKSVVTDIADWFVSIEERLADTVDSIKTDLANLIGVGQLIVNSDGVVSGLITNRRSDSLDVNTPGRGTNTVGTETINNFTFYSNESINEVKAAKLLKETQRDLAEGYL